MSKLNLLSNANWNYKTAAHLLNRAGFGGPPAEIEKLSSMGMEGAVSYLVDYEKIPVELNPGSNFSQPEPNHEEAAKTSHTKLLGVQRPGESDEDYKKRMEEGKKLLPQKQAEKKEVTEFRQEACEALREWWIRQMAYTPRPFQEKMVLFFHGHFACGGHACQEAYFRYLQNQLFRDKCLGSWEDMLVSVTKDPCMLRSLDNQKNFKGKPNENYARELMELYTLGVEYYTEQDVTEGARALTGWGIDDAKLCFIYRPEQHDNGEKTYMGLKGNLGPLEIIHQIVKQPQAARFITSKLWKFFTDQNPSEKIATALADEFRGSGMILKPVMKLMFSCEDFYAPDMIGRQIKGPIQWLANSIRLLERDLPERKYLNTVQDKMSQELFKPPTVKGWDGGAAWINTNTMLARYNLVAGVISGPGDKSGGTIMHGKTMANATKGKVEQELSVKKLFTDEQLRDSSKLLAELQKRFLQVPLAGKRQDDLVKYVTTQKQHNEDTLRTAVQMIMTTPEYQLC